MTRGFSTYLDLVRFMAALTVMVSHFTFPAFTGGIVPYQGSLAGLAVTVFFVLSGYVIAYVANEKETTLSDYAVSRAARVYSVAVPAIVLTMISDFVVCRFSTHCPAPLYEYHALWKYLPVFLTFTNEVAGQHAVMLSNGVFWSLSYEVWYYIAFALAFYLRGGWRVASVVAAVVILGIPALLYFPVWILGAVLYFIQKRGYAISSTFAAPVAALSALSIIAFHISGADDRLDSYAIGLIGSPAHAYPVLHNSVHFSTHYIYGALVGLHFFAMRSCNLEWISTPIIGKPIVYAASFTFALYLSHRTLMNLWALVLHHNPHSALSIALLFMIVLLSAFLFGFISEKRKRDWRTLFRRLMAPLTARSSLSSSGRT